MGEEIGSCDEVAVEEVGSTKVIFFRNSSSRCQVSTLLIRGSTQNILDNVERAVDDAVSVFKCIVKDGREDPGADATALVTSLIASHQQGNWKDGIDVDELKVSNTQDLQIFDPKKKQFFLQKKKKKKKKK